MSLNIPAAIADVKATNVADRCAHNSAKNCAAASAASTDRMAITTETMAPLERAGGEAWDNAVSEFPGCTPFHSSAWARVLASTYGHAAHYGLMKMDGEVAACLPIMEVSSPWTGKRGVSLPFSDTCGALAKVNRADPTAAAVLHGALVQRVKRLVSEFGWKHAELRGGDWPRESARESAAVSDGAQPGAPPTDSPQPDVPQRGTYVGHVLELEQPFSATESLFSGATRRGVRKAIAAGLRTRLASDPTRDRHFHATALEAYYELHQRTRRRHGLPPQSLAFFRHVYEEMIGAEQGFVILAETAGGRPVAGAVFFRFGDSAVFKFGASHAETWAQRPNNLVMAEAIRVLTESGVRTLHFGRTEPENHGLRRFKMGWGAREVPLLYRRVRPASKRPGKDMASEVRDARSGECDESGVTLRAQFAGRQWFISSVPAADVPSEHGAGSLCKRGLQRFPLCIHRLAGKLLYPHLD